MATEWHYSKGGQQHGPISAADLNALAKSGELLPTDMIWKEGMAEWKPAGSLKGLFPPTTAPAPKKAPPPLPTKSSVKSSGIDVVHPAVMEVARSTGRRILADRLLLLCCCLGISVLLTWVVPSILAPRELTTIHYYIAAEPEFEGVEDIYNDPRIKAEVQKRERENTRNEGRRTTSYLFLAAFLLTDIVLAGLTGFVAYRRYFATAIDKLYDKGGPELPPKFPWTSEERAAPNPKHLWAKVGIGACIAIGVVCLLSIVGAIFCLPFFSAAILIYVFGINKRLFHGRWLPSAGKGWIEFLPGHVVKREDGSVGSFALLPNQQFIDFLDNGRLVDCWKVLAFEHSTHLEVVDVAGKTLNFKRAKIGVYKGSSIFSTSRADDLQGSWQPMTEENEWVQFTKDGAVVFSDGSAGRFTLIGEEPNEVIELEMVKGASRQFRIVSLTSDQLVIAEGQEATTFRRPKRPSAKTAKGVETSSNDSTEADETKSGVTQKSKGILGGLFAFFTKDKCTKCGRYSAEAIHRRRTGDIEQRVESRPDPNTNYRSLRQMVVNCWTEEISYRCNDCKHSWTEMNRESQTA